MVTGPRSRSGTGHVKPIVQATEAGGVESREASLALARLDFGADGGLRTLDVLWTDTAGTGDGGASRIASSVRLAWNGSHRHRTIVFGLFRLGRRIELRDRIVVTPQCCCGAELCA